MWKSLTKKFLVLRNVRVCPKTNNFKIIISSARLVSNRSYLPHISVWSNQQNKALVHQQQKWYMMNTQSRVESSKTSPPVSSVSGTPDLKTPLSSTKKSKSTDNDANKNRKPDLFKLLAVFASGALAYFAISLYLDNKSSGDSTINYSSNNLPGRIHPSKLVK